MIEHDLGPVSGPAERLRRAAAIAATAEVFPEDCREPLAAWLRETADRADPAARLRTAAYRLKQAADAEEYEMPDLLPDYSPTGMRYICDDCLWLISDGLELGQCEPGCPREIEHVGFCYPESYAGDTCQRCGARNRLNETLTDEEYGE